MLDAFLDALTGRRLGGALFVLAGLIVAGVVLWPSGDDGGETPRSAARVQRARIVSVPQLGLTFAYPRDVVARRVAAGHPPARARRARRSMTFSSPVEGRHDRSRSRPTRKDALRKRYAPAKIVKDGPAKLGPRKVTSFELAGRGARRARARARASSAARSTARTS